MTAERRIRMFPMPAKRADREEEELPSVLPRRDDRGRATLIANIAVGGTLLLFLGGLLTAYSLQWAGAW